MKRPTFLLRAALLSAAFTPALVWAAPATAVKAPGKAAKVPAKTATAMNAANASADAKWQAPLTGNDRILNAINRLTFGPRPGDVADVRQMGLNRWINQQINADSIDDSALDKELSSFKMLNATPEILLLAYKGNNGKIRRALQQQTRVAAGKPATNGLQKAEVLDDREKSIIQDLSDAGLDTESLYQALGELTAAKLARATDSKRQLQEVLVDFWSNHFNLDVNKKQVSAFKVLDDRDTIRPHVFTTFRELLGASAHSPAMMVYLDNATSTADNATQGNTRNKRQQKAKKKAGGLNENYGREIMELHTLGVDGGYTQGDVTEVARCFTGWSVGQDGAFTFRAFAHDNGEKTVLGHAIPAGGGQKDGKMVLDILASHPATAKHLAFQLCQRFIADAPPQSAVDAVAKSFTDSGGDLKKVYATLFATPEFNSKGAYRSKIKSPLEFAVSAVRALDGTFALPDPDNPRQREWLALIGYSSRDRSNNRGNLPRRPLASEIATMGQPLWGYQAPTGYPENSQQWVSSSALISRLNFALSLTTGRVGDVAIEKDTFSNTDVAAVADNLLSTPLSAQSLSTIKDEVKTTPGDGAKVRALILGSPEFQRR